ncbi:hypothetical protein [Clostridium baratii]|nr:hypothetical protein [Clostridium baratii]
MLASILRILVTSLQCITKKFQPNIFKMRGTKELVATDFQVCRLLELL